MITSFWLVQRTQSTTENVLKARAQRTTLVRLLSTVQDAETGQRGYLLTGEPRYLEPYEMAVSNLEKRLAEVGAAFEDGPQDGPRIEQIKKEIAQKLSELAETIQTYKAGKASEALDIVKSDRGKDLMDQIRTSIGDMFERVDKKLSEGVEGQRVDAAAARQFSLLAGAFILLAALGGIATIVKYTRQLVLARNELRELNTGLENRVKERTADLQRANEEIQRFAYIVSHDLRAPLVNVMGYTSELEASLETLRALTNNPEINALANAEAAKAAVTTDLPESIGFIRTSTQKMDGLIKAILKLSREGQRVLAPESINLGDFFDSIAGAVQHRVSSAEGEIRILKPLATIEGDRLALEQIFGNLVDNALKYRAKDRPPVITIRQASSRWGMVEIDVEDNGRGIAADDRDRVFDLFRRAGPQDQQGEGIGLAHVRALVRRLGGEITMTSELGRGTKFRVTLPTKLNIRGE
ncbi:CHASE3 domain-containing protein [Hyphomicrobium sp. 99]|uniref:sensor histidine kinase n=1 Tax=Hyphomicrobium sp. 99 TaxID=1163419 RepID=UPI001FD89D68|nr:CHASE3 domain-containing protein [Hyphomicrobium sp. 99]